MSADPPRVEAPPPSLAELGVTRVLLIDDAVDVQDRPWFDDTERWSSFIEGLREPLEASDLDVEGTEDLRDEMESAARQAALTRVETIVGTEVFAAAVSDIEGNPETTRRWVDELTRRGPEVVLARDRAHVEQLIAEGGPDVGSFFLGFDLILLDYEFIRGDEGERSKEIAAWIRASTAKADRPPLLVKFSRLPAEQLESERAQFAEAVKYPRGCYHFLEKAEVNADWFDRLLAAVIQNGRIGQKLYAVAKVVSDTIAKESEAGVAEMLVGRLDPTSARLMFSHGLRLEGMSEVEYLIELVAGVLSVKAHESDEVAGAMREFLNALAGAPIDARPADSAGLVLLETELKFDQTVNHFRRPLGFGDLYQFEGTNRVGLVITRQSELMVRGEVESDATAGPKSTWITLSLGRLVSDDLPFPDGATPGPRLPGSPGPQRIAWDDATVSVPRAVFDLAAFREDGAATIENAAPASPWWTAAFTSYLQSQLTAVRATTTALPDGRRRVAVYADASVSGESVFGSGTFLEASADGQLPIRRLARLRRDDTLAETQRILALTGRIGGPPELDARRTRRKIYFGEEDKGIWVEALDLTFRDEMHHLDAESSAIRKALRGARGFEALAADTTDYSGQYNLNTVERLGYRLRPGTGTNKKILLPKSDQVLASRAEEGALPRGRRTRRVAEASGSVARSTNKKDEPA